MKVSTIIYNNQHFKNINDVLQQPTTINIQSINYFGVKIHALNFKGIGFIKCSSRTYQVYHRVSGASRSKGYQEQTYITNKNICDILHLVYIDEFCFCHFYK